MDDGIKRIMHDTDSLRMEVVTLHEKYDNLVLMERDTGDIPDRIFDILFRMNQNADMIEGHAETIVGSERDDLLAYVEDIRDFLDENVIIESETKIRSNKHHCKECGRLFEGDSMFCSRKCESSYYDLNDEDS